MKMFKINCPFCDGNSVSDVIDSIEEVDGEWECNNGHQFVIKYIRTMKKNQETPGNKLFKKWFL